MFVADYNPYCLTKKHALVIVCTYKAARMVNKIF